MDKQIKNMNEKSEKISNALNLNSSRILKVCKPISKSPSFGFIAHQVCRSSSSAGANYEEACGAESHADFIHKMHIAYKELRETKYWLNLIISAELAKKDDLNEILDSTEELLRILGKSLITSKKNSGKK